MYSVSQKSALYPTFGKIPHPKVNKSAVSKKDLSLAVNDETLEKMRQMGYNNAKSGNLCGSEYFSYLNQCREKVAPDRSKICAEAESKMRRACRQLQRKTDKDSILDYLLEWLSKDRKKEYCILDTSGSLNAGGSFVGRCGSTGWLNINAYDENGECIGFYSSDSTPSGWRAIQTEAEKECIHSLSAAYAEGTKAYYAEKKAEEQTLREKILSQMDFYA